MFVSSDVSIGYRFFPHPGSVASNPVVVMFHGNAEIAADYDHAYSQFHSIGASLLVFDFRGYGWGTGRPLLTKLTSGMVAFGPD